MPARPAYMPPTAVDSILAVRPWLRAVAEEHIRAHPELVDGRHGPNAEDATSGFARTPLAEGFAGQVRQICEDGGIDTRSWSNEELMAQVPEDVGQEVLATIVREYTALLNFMLSGEKTFFFAANLSERLADTELNVPVELFSLPFRSCAFVYDNDTARDAFHALSGNRAPPNGPVTVFLTLMGSEGEQETVAAYSLHTDGRRTHFATVRSLRMDNVRTVEEALRTVHERLEGDERQPGTVDDEEFFGPGLRFHRMVMNSVLYLSSADPDVSEERRNQLPPEVHSLPPKRRRPFYRELEKASRSAFVLVGEQVARVPAPPSDGSGRKLDSRFKVRAHWRSQPYGEGRALRRNILIEEHWKGPDAAEIVSRPYVVR